VAATEQSAAEHGCTIGGRNQDFVPACQLLDVSLLACSKVGKPFARKIGRTRNPHDSIHGFVHEFVEANAFWY
jgi:hypothetical protein